MNEYYYLQPYDDIQLNDECRVSIKSDWVLLDWRISGTVDTFPSWYTFRRKIQKTIKGNRTI